MQEKSHGNPITWFPDFVCRSGLLACLSAGGWWFVWRDLDLLCRQDAGAIVSKEAERDRRERQSINAKEHSMKAAGLSIALGACFFLAGCDQAPPNRPAP